MIFFLTLVMAAATVGIFIFNAQLAYVTRQMTNATEAALDTYRPYLLVTKISVEASHVDLEHASLQYRHNFYFKIAVKNFGNSPADILTYTADADTHSPPRLPSLSDTPPIYGVEAQLNDSIIGPNEDVPSRLNTSLSLDDREYNLCKTDEKRIAVFGRIRYRGASATVFETFFYYWWFACDPEMPFIRCLTKRFNDHT